MPDGWPSSIVKREECIKSEKQQKTEINSWYVKFNEEWHLFYSFDLNEYQNSLKLVPAFIYHRKSIEGKEVIYPIVQLFFSIDGCVCKASKSWCDDVLKYKGYYML